jgi:hypothetical protein
MLAVDGALWVGGDFTKVGSTRQAHVARFYQAGTGGLMSGSIARTLPGRIRGLLERRSYLPGDEPVALDELVSPLRYDIMVRAEHFRFLDEHLELLERDVEAYLRLVRGHPYFTWYTTVALPRYRPRAHADEQRRFAAFRRRVLGAAVLWRSFKAVGFDPRQPVTLRIARPGAVTPTGKAVRRRYHAGDGCHRLALLVAVGEPTLPPDWYRVRNDPLPSLFDNTSALIGPLDLGRATYYGFVARGYGAGPATSREAIVRHVEVHAPDRLAELLQLLAVDEQELDQVEARRSVPEPGSNTS